MWKDNSQSLSEILSLLELAVDGAKEGITISDMQDPNQPLIFVNKGFELTTGYSDGEVLGKNCRFLQGLKTEKENESALKILKEALDKAQACVVLLKNYRKNGEMFWNRLSLTPVLDDKQKLTHFIGIQTDVTIEILAKQKLAIAYKKVEENLAVMEQDLTHASFVQQSILPIKFPDTRSVNFSLKFEPMSYIGGDFYDVFEIKPGVYGIMVADVTGHGASAAMLTLMAYNVFRDASRESESPKEVMRQTNQNLYKKIPTGKFVTMFYGIINEKSQTFSYCQAGHPCAFVIKESDAKVMELSTDSSMLGIFDDATATFTQHSISLDAGDKVLLYTDAIIEAQSHDQKYFGKSKLEQLLSKTAFNPIEMIINQIYKDGLDFIAANQYDINPSFMPSYQDDITLLGFEIKTHV